MSIEFVLVPVVDQRSSHLAVSSSFFFDPAIARRHLSAAAASGFSAVLIDDASGPLANLDIVANVARWNSSFDLVLTHWAGVTSPAETASDLAALDRLTGGRLSLRILNGEAEADGPLKDWQRTDEYLTLLKRLWSNGHAIDHEGPFYSLRGALVPDKGPSGHAIPIRMSGYTGKAIEVAARHATVFELPEMSASGAASLIDRVLKAAARYGRTNAIGFAGHVHAGDGRLPHAAETIRAFLSIGVSQFIISGLDDVAALERFGDTVIAPLQAAEEYGHAGPHGLVTASLAMGLI